MSSAHGDQKYMQALAEGNTLLLDELYERFAGKIKWMVLQNNGSEQDAADIFQEALVDLYRKAKNGFVLTCPMDAFLYVICRNRWINELKRRKSTGVTFNDGDGYDKIGEDSFAEAEQLQTSQLRKALLREKIRQLGESCRKLLELSWSGKRMEEVAVLMNTTYAYIRKKKSECIGKLVEMIKNSPDYKTLLY